MSARLLRRYPSYAVKGNLDRDPLSGDLVDPQLDFGEVAGAERLADLVLVVDVVGHVSHARSSGHCRADLRGAHERTSAQAASSALGVRGSTAGRVPNLKLLAPGHDTRGFFGLSEASHKIRESGE